MSVKLDGPLLLAGAGKMGGALLAGLIECGLDPASVVVQDPSPPAEVAALLRRLGIEPVASVGPLVAPPAVIMAAVKPQVMEQVFPPLARIAGPHTLVVSIAAGRSIASFEKHLRGDTAVVRAMPNTPAAIGRGMTVCCANAATNAAQRALATELLSAVGLVMWVGDEGMMDAVTAVSGSGPAYVFLLAECLEAAAREAGLDGELSRELARQTVAGAGELLFRSHLDAAVLRQNVASPGGTTAAALAVLMGATGLKELMTRAVLAARDRSRELSR